MNTYKCVKKTIKGKETKWYQVYKYIRDHHAVSKKEIINSIWPTRHNLNKCFCSDMFSAMRKCNIIDYDSRTKTWSVYRRKI